MKLRPAASKIAQPTWSVDWTKIGATLFGRRCQVRIRQREAPGDVERTPAQEAAKAEMAPALVRALALSRDAREAADDEPNAYSGTP